MPLPDSFSLLVLGCGVTGLDVVRWALSHPERVNSVTVYGGAKSAPSERTAALEEAGARFVFDREEIDGDFDICVASPGISERSAFFAHARAASGEIMGEPEFAYRLSPDRWCAVTGTNGKTTVTSLIDHLLNECGCESVAVGNIGTSAISRVDGRLDACWFSAELSSYQLATTSELHPRVAVLMNIAPDHLSWHGSFAAYTQAKLKVFANMGPGDTAIVDVEDEGVRAVLDDIAATGAHVVSVGLADSGSEDAAFLRDGRLVVRLDGCETVAGSASELRLIGRHNLINALAASAAALACGALPASLPVALRSFAPLPHRIEPVGEVDGVRYVNDSKATNCSSTEVALDALSGERIVLLLGGSDKGTDLSEFMEKVASSCCAVVCFGAARERFKRALDEAARIYDLDIACADDLRDAVDVARSLAQGGDVVLLSPACASFDEFSGYEERGRAFADYVSQLSHGSDVVDVDDGDAWSA